MSYLDTLTQQQKNNINVIKDEAKKNGITNPYSIAAILSIVSKESSFIPTSENLNYSASGLQKTFKLSSARANELAHKPEAIGNAVYGGKGGNASNEGYKYRGRGFNQLTFKNAYKYYGDKIGIDLVSNPDKLNNVDVAAKVLMEYNKKGFEELNKKGKLKEYHSTGINDFNNLEDATMAFYHVTAGTGKDVNYIKSLKNKDSLGGMTKALQRVEDLYLYAKDTITKNPIKTGVLLGILGIGIYILYNKVIKKK